MSSIPQRFWYSKSEAAQLTGQSVTTINRRIREGRKPFPGPDAILPEHTRQFGDQLKISHAYITGEPVNVTPIRPAPITQEQIEAAMVNAIRRFIGDAVLRKVG